MVLISATAVIAAAALAVAIFKRRPAVSLGDSRLEAIPMTGANDNHITLWRNTGVI
jgi:hypothetical protein